jgi:SAM-dependent methyltransferase
MASISTSDVPRSGSSTSADAQRLRLLPMFADATDDELAKVLARSLVLARDAGSVLVAEGAPGDEVFVILDGAAEVTRRGEPVARLGPGDLFGEMAAFDGGVRTATVTATSDVELLLIAPQGIAEVIPPGSLAHKVLGTLSERLRLSQELPDWSATIASTAAYTLGAEASERDRLVTQAHAWAPIAESLLDRLEVAPGQRVIDVACGPLGILDLLGQRVGPTGQVFGLDREPRMIEMARELAAERGQPVELVVGDAAAPGLPQGGFDVVHARALLINVVNVDEIIAQMVRLARPGGLVALQDPDCGYWVCDPPHPAWDRLLGVAHTTWHVQGRDAGIGRTLGRLLRRAGLEDVHAQAHVLTTVPGDLLHKNLLGVADAARPLIIESGVYDDAGLANLTATLHGHLDQPETTTAWAIWQAWGRRPSA